MKFIIISLQLFAITNLLGQSTVAKFPFYEGFDYPLGADLRPEGTPQDATAPNRGLWIYKNNGTIISPSPVLVEQPWVNSKGLPKCKGNAMRFKAGLHDPIIVIPTQPKESGSLYASFLIRINSWTTSNQGEFFETWVYNGVQEPIFCFLKDIGEWPNQRSISSTHVFIKRDDVGDGFTIGISEAKAIDKIEYSSKKFKLGEDILIVTEYKYDLKEGTSYLWINPTVTAVEPLATVNTLSDKYSSEIKESSPIRHSLDKIKFNRNSNSKTPDVTVDELRIANTWREVVGLP